MSTHHDPSKPPHPAAVPPLISEADISDRQESALARAAAAHARVVQLRARREALAGGVVVNAQDAEEARCNAVKALERARIAHHEAAKRHLDAERAHQRAAASHEEAALRADDAHINAHQEAAERHRTEAAAHAVAAQRQFEQELAGHSSVNRLLPSATGHR